jgi:hypothetical protein
MLKFTFDLNLLKAAALCASKDATRYYLAGVKLEYNKDGLFLIATDGKRLVAFHPNYTGDHDGDVAAFASYEAIIPLDLIKAIKINKRIPDGTVICDGDKITIEYLGSSSSMNRIDGMFPAWRRVIPQKTETKIAQFNPDFVADFVKINNMLGGRSECLAIGHNGLDAALIDLDIDVPHVAVIMPVRKPESAILAPVWALPEFTVSIAA